MKAGALASELCKKRSPDPGLFQEAWLPELGALSPAATPHQGEGGEVRRDIHSSEPGCPGHDSQLCHWRAVWPGEMKLTSLIFGVLTCKMRTTTVL